MLLERKSRFFLRFNLTFRASRNVGEPLPFRSDDDEKADVESALEWAIKHGKAKLEIKQDDIVELMLVETRPKQNIAALLFRRRNPDAAEQIFEHRKTRKLRKSGKLEDEDVAHSAHLFVNLRAHPGNRYDAILEEVPGLGRSYIDAILGRALREVPYTTEDRRGRDIQTHSVVDFTGVKSETLGNALEQGTLSIVELVRPAKVEGLDTEGLIAPKEERMKLTIKATPTQSLPLVRRIRRWADERDWDDVRVLIRLPEDRSRVVSVARQADAADALFVRAEQVFVDHDLDVCTEIVNEELLSRARKMFEGD